MSQKHSSHQTEWSIGDFKTIHLYICSLMAVKWVMHQSIINQPIDNIIFMFSRKHLKNPLPPHTQLLIPSMMCRTISPSTVLTKPIAVPQVIQGVIGRDLLGKLERRNTDILLQILKWSGYSFLISPLVGSAVLQLSATVSCTIVATCSVFSIGYTLSLMKRFLKVVQQAPCRIRKCFYSG